MTRPRAEAVFGPSSGLVSWAEEQESLKEAEAEKRASEKRKREKLKGANLRWTEEDKRRKERNSSSKS